MTEQKKARVIEDGEVLQVAHVRRADGRSQRGGGEMVDKVAQPNEVKEDIDGSNDTTSTLRVNLC